MTYSFLCINLIYVCYSTESNTRLYQPMKDTAGRLCPPRDGTPTPGQLTCSILRATFGIES